MHRGKSGVNHSESMVFHEDQDQGIMINIGYKVRVSRDDRVPEIIIEVR